MIWRNPFRPPSIPDCGRELAEFRCLKERERVKARARLMNEQMGRPVPEALR
jgi:hypothetical protein